MTLQNINIAVVESSVIIRSGLVTVLKRLDDVKVNATEITSIEGLQHCLRGHDLDIVLVNPSFGGWFNLKEVKAQYPNLGVKFMAIVCNVTDMNMIEEYDDKIALYDDADTLKQKITKLMNFEEENTENEEQETLSQREKEIICCVVKGLTNKEIAEQLFISVHTVMTHRRNISKKLQIHSPAGLTIYAIVNKLVELKEVKM